MIRTWVEIDLSAVRDNVQAIRGLIGPDRKILAVLKADAYGHGAVALARVVADAGVTRIAVANYAEGMELRESGIACPIHILGISMPEEVAPALKANLVLTVHNRQGAEAVEKEAGNLNRRVAVHVKVDTGMGRLGVHWTQAADLFSMMASMRHLAVEGLFTHFAVADEVDNPFTKEQLQRLHSVIAALPAAIAPRWRHAANSAAVLFHPEAYLDMVRPGLLLHGLAPGGVKRLPKPFRSALSFKSTVTSVKELSPGDTAGYGRMFEAKRKTLLATVPVGYADDLHRDLSGKGFCVVGGRRVPIAGRISMDVTLLDVTDAGPVVPGDEVVLIGCQGNAEVLAEEWADWQGTIPYEVTCALGRRVKRVYVNGAPGAAAEESV